MWFEETSVLPCIHSNPGLEALNRSKTGNHPSETKPMSGYAPESSALIFGSLLELRQLSRNPLKFIGFG